MSKVQNPVTGRSSGKLGNLVFSSWKGINILKTKAMPSGKPARPLQVIQRNKFKAIMSYARFIASLISWSFNKLAIGKSSFNVFISKNLQFIDDVTLKFKAANLGDLLFSLGTLFGLDTVTVTPGAGGILTVTWNAGYMSETRLVDDVVSIVSYNATSNELVAHVADELYSAESDVLSGLGATGDIIHLYMFTSRANDSDSSDSQYFGPYTLLA